MAHEPKQARIALHCMYCKRGWIEETTLRWDSTWGYHSDAGATHDCEHIRKALWDMVARLSRNGKIYVPFRESDQRWETSRLLKHSLVKGFLNPDVPCDGRCINAHGPSCDCACGGKNHGSGTSANAL